MMTHLFIFHFPSPFLFYFVYMLFLYAFSLTFIFYIYRHFIQNWQKTGYLFSSPSLIQSRSVPLHAQHVARCLFMPAAISSHSYSHSCKTFGGLSDHLFHHGWLDSFLCCVFLFVICLFVAFSSCAFQARALHGTPRSFIIIHIYLMFFFLLRTLFTHGCCCHAVDTFAWHLWYIFILHFYFCSSVCVLLCASAFLTTWHFIFRALRAARTLVWHFFSVSTGTGSKNNSRSLTPHSAQCWFLTGWWYLGSSLSAHSVALPLRNFQAGAGQGHALFIIFGVSCAWHSAPSVIH